MLSIGLDLQTRLSDSRYTTFSILPIRRPGAVMLYALVSGVTWAFASPFGLFGMFASVIDGLMAELTLFVTTRYKDFSDKKVLMWSILYALFVILIAGILFGGLMIDPPVAIAAGLAGLVSYAIAGLVAPRLAELIARTGVLSSTALGRERLQEV